MNPHNPENQGEEVSEWVDAPAESHVAGFQLVDRSKSEFGASTEIIITFKGGGKNHRAPATYRFRSTKHNQMRAVFDALKGSTHPGEVIHAELIKKNVPYIGPI